MILADMASSLFRGHDSSNSVLVSFLGWYRWLDCDLWLFRLGVPLDHETVGGDALRKRCPKPLDFKEGSTDES